jgi:hypothetical protein
MLKWMKSVQEVKSVVGVSTGALCVLIDVAGLPKHSPFSERL